ncbi:hypothetical protein XIS1_1270002 [Xenorhabdus innexi]|uniref:Uncharacterized protein n=1 Tax=Xenorhabdus innexi TaxID=290109 RepID=A0A1N6MSG5_9GAMM|nr:hypothetical protein XIS1_1270002 [Xenorhabdus innexi]
MLSGSYHTFHAPIDNDNFKGQAEKSFQSALVSNIQGQLSVKRNNWLYTSH